MSRMFAHRYYVNDITCQRNTLNARKGRAPKSPVGILSKPFLDPFIEMKCQAILQLQTMFTPISYPVNSNLTHNSYEKSRVSSPMPDALEKKCCNRKTDFSVSNRFLLHS